ncbi:hypothetical protein GCM10010468_32190 [Actinocorallia longicatena]|uniref:Uncharacterized protein n=1 Tax=Actinocorallia longicatena TaxID=111803 RepID=A0ABP6QCK0_9ACTN
MRGRWVRQGAGSCRGWCREVKKRPAWGGTLLPVEGVALASDALAEQLAEHRLLLEEGYVVLGGLLDELGVHGDLPGSGAVLSDTLNLALRPPAPHEADALSPGPGSREARLRRLRSS